MIEDFYVTLSNQQTPFNVVMPDTVNVHIINDSIFVDGFKEPF